MKNKVQKAILALLFMTSSHAAMADNGLQYSYAQFLYNSAELGIADGSGFSFGGSFQLDTQFYVRGDFQNLNMDEGIDNIRTIELGAGYIHPLGSMDLIAEVNYVDAEIEYDNRNTRDYDETGFLFTGGLRTYLAPELEVNASMNHLNLDGHDNYIQLGANYRLTHVLAVDSGYRLGSDIEVFTIGARYIF